MDPNKDSGIYKCTKCGNEETHVKGKPFAPCSKCGANSWELVKRTDNK
jgi:DNA-directed RNA polymerase subunit RPC12/RpoP